MIGKHYRRRAGIITLVVFIAVLLIGQSIPLAYAGDLESNQTQNAEQKEDISSNDTSNETAEPQESAENSESVKQQEPEKTQDTSKASEVKESQDSGNSQIAKESEINKQDISKPVSELPKTQEGLDSNKNINSDSEKYQKAGSFEGEISDIFDIKAEYGDNTFPAHTEFITSSYMNEEKVRTAEKKMIELSGKTDKEVSIRRISGMEIAFKENYTNKLIQPANNNSVKISIKRKDGRKLRDGEKYQLLHLNGKKLEPVEFTVDESGVIHFESKTFSPFYLGVIGPAKSPTVSGLTLPVDSPLINSQTKDSEGVYDFPINPGKDGIFNLVLPKEAFRVTEFRLSVSLPPGMIFDKGSLDKLKSKDEVLSVEYDANNPNSVVATFKKNPAAMSDLATALAYHTGVEHMSRADLNDMIVNGPKKSTIRFKLLDSDGGLMGENTHYTVRPKTGKTATANISSNFTTKVANIAVYTNVNNTMYKWDYFKKNLYPLVNLDIPEIDKGNNKLIRIKRVKVYRPVGLEDKCYADNIRVYSGYNNKEIKKTNTNPLTDSKGTYDLYEFKYDPNEVPNAYSDVEYNKLKQTSIWAMWKFKEDEFLPANKLFEAADTEVTFETEKGEEIVKTATGTKMKTTKGRYDDRFKVIPKSQYKKDSANIKTVLPGHPVFEQKFVDIYNETYTENYDTNGDLFMSEGAFTETYHFPYEIRPTVFNRQTNVSYLDRELGKMTLTIKKADGSVVNKDIPENEIQGPSGKISLAEYMESGDRISDIRFEWKIFKHSATSNDDPFKFDYRVSREHEDGSPLVKDELIKIGYEAEHPKKDGSSYTYSTNSDTDYLYLKVGEEKCNEFAEEGQIGTKDIYTFGYKSKFDYNRYPYAGGVFLRGDRDSYKTLYKNPVITLKARTNNINGVEEPMSFIGGFGVYERMSGWKIIYSSYNKKTAETKTNQEYTIPKIKKGLITLTKKDIGLSDDEFFTAIQFKYNGDLTLDYTKDLDYIELDKIQFRLFSTLIDVTRTHSLYNNQEFTVPGGALARGKIEVDAFLKYDNPCPGTVYTNPDGVESKPRNNNGVHLSFANKDQSWLITAMEFKSDNRTITTYQGSTATAEQSELLYSFGLFGENGGAFNGAFDITRNDLNSEEAMVDSTPKLDVPEAVYIELKDPEFDVASVQSAELNTDPRIRRYPITDSEVSVISVNGKRYLKISSGNLPGHFNNLTDSGWRVVAQYALAKINLQAWNGASLGVHHPLGKVYYDISNLLTKYDGSAASGNIKYTFKDAVPDSDNIRGTGDTTTPTLFKVGDMSDFTVNVLQHVFNGVQLYPGKNNIVDRQKPVSFFSHEKNSLLVSEQINIPGTTTDAEVVIKMPEKGESVSVSKYDEKGKVINNTKKNDYSMNIKGKAVTYQISGKATGDTLTYSYSKDGTTFVPESAITSPDDLKDYRYVKMTFKHKATPGSDVNIEVRIPVEAKEEAAKKEDLNAYVTGNYHFKAGSESTDSKCSTAEYVFKAYTVNGTLWRDKNEDGVLDKNSPIGADSGIVVKLKDSNGDVIGTTANPEIGKINADGTFTIRTNHLDSNYTVSLELPDELKVTKHTGTTDPTSSGTDSDFDRTTLTTQAFHGFDVSGNANNISAGIIRLPKLPTDDQFVHVTDEHHKLGIKAISDNPDKPNPAITFTAINDPIMDLDTDGVVTPKKTGVVKQLQMKTSNTLGDTVTGKFNVFVYSNVIYKNEESGVSGNAPTDLQKYYPSTSGDTDKVTVMGSGTLRKSGYRLIGWKDKDGKIYKSGDKFTTGEVEKDTILTAVWEKIPLSKIKSKKPNTGDMTNQGAYIAIIVSAAALLIATYIRSKFNE